MVKFVEGLNPDEPGVRRINYAIGAEHTPEWYAHIARLEAGKTAEKGRLAARKDVPARRKPPGNDGALVSWSDEEFVFAQDQNRDVELMLSRLRVYSTGIRFDLIAREQDGGKDTFIGERIYLTHRFRRPHKHRIYLGVVLPNGKIATNNKIATNKEMHSAPGARR